MEDAVAVLEVLRNDLESAMEIEQVFQKHVVDGPSFFFLQAGQSQNDEYLLRHELAKACGASINDVVIVGSAKMGFSVKNQHFVGFDSKVMQTKLSRDRSDLDIAIINTRFFEQVAEQIYEMSRHFDKEWIHHYWQNNQYYCGEKNLFFEYTKSLAGGWLRPDYLPNVYLTSAEWIPPCTAWSAKLDRKVAVGLFSNWTYLKHYHMDHLEILRAKLQTLV